MAKNIFEICDHIFLKNEKNKVDQNCLKWRENCSKMFFEIFDKIFYLSRKNQSCLKLPEMARKLIENVC